MRISRFSCFLNLRIKSEKREARTFCYWLGKGTLFFFLFGTQAPPDECSVFYFFFFTQFLYNGCETRQTLLNHVRPLLTNLPFSASLSLTTFSLLWLLLEERKEKKTQNHLHIIVRKCCKKKKGKKRAYECVNAHSATSTKQALWPMTLVAHRWL